MKECAICLSNLGPGQGQAIFTAECSHSFHFICIANNVKHGNLTCPVCRATWNALPFQAPTTNVAADLTQQNVMGRIHAPLHHHHHPEPLCFSDDEPLPSSSTSPIPQVSGPQNQTLTIESFTEYSAISAAESRPEFPVLVRVRAPPLQDNGHEPTPIDLVTILDVSGSMCGTKLALLKRAVKFVIEKLGPSDRLSIVSFSTTAQRVFPLKRMTADGRESAILAVESLTSDGRTNIAEGLKKGIRVLKERRERNQVASIIFLSDGNDNCRERSLLTSPSIPSRVFEFLNQLPSNREHGRIPIHTFGFGTDHDPTTMHGISDTSGGTFSFIESVGMIQDAFAMCIGGLLTVVAHQLQIMVKSVSPGVQIVSVPSGSYASEISDGGQQAVVDVGNVYAEEERQFLVYLLVPAVSSPANTENGGEREGNKTSLLDVSCKYKDLASNELVEVRGERVEIFRPEVWSPTDEAVSLEVDRQRNRILVTRSIVEAQERAEMGNLEAARSVLEERRLSLLSSSAAQAGDGLSHWLGDELRQTRDRMANRETYRQTGRAYTLSGLSSHSLQRASSRGDQTLPESSEGENSHKRRRTTGYVTPSMVNMVTMSRNLGVDSAPAPPNQEQRTPNQEQ